MTREEIIEELVGHHPGIEFSDRDKELIEAANSMIYEAEIEKMDGWEEYQRGIVDMLINAVDGGE